MVLTTVRPGITSLDTNGELVEPTCACCTHPECAPERENRYCTRFLLAQWQLGRCCDPEEVTALMQQCLAGLGRPRYEASWYRIDKQSPSFLYSTVVELPWTEPYSVVELRRLLVDRLQAGAGCLWPCGVSVTPLACCSRVFFAETQRWCRCLFPHHLMWKREYDSIHHAGEDDLTADLNFMAADYEYPPRKPGWATEGPHPSQVDGSENE